MFSSLLHLGIWEQLFPSVLPQTDARIESYRRVKGQIRIPGQGLQGRLFAVRKDSWGWWCESGGELSGWHAQKLWV